MENIFIHKYANIFPMMTYVEFEALKADIQEHGLLEPIEVYQGKIIDGRNRYKACDELKIEPTFKEWEGEDVLTYIISKNLHRRHLTDSQRAMVAARLANMKQGERTDRPPDEPSANLPKVVSQEKASEILNVGDRSIRSAKKVIEKATPELVKAVDEGKVAVSLAEKAAQLPKEEQEQLVEEVDQGAKPSKAYREIAKEPPAPKPVPEKPTEETAPEPTSKPHIANGTGNNEWYTPPEIIESARKVLLRIDLDPASCEQANEVVLAKRIYTIQDNGLEKPWAGNIWLNPPYAADLIPQFINKLETERENIRAAIVLANNATETQWFWKLVRMSEAVCFPTGRVKFWGPEGEKNTPLQGQAIAYIGESTVDFVREFVKFGWVATFGLYKATARG